jgi:hypothetical protein
LFRVANDLLSEEKYIRLKFFVVDIVDSFAGGKKEKKLGPWSCLPPEECNTRLKSWGMRGIKINKPA